MRLTSLDLSARGEKVSAVGVLSSRDNDWMLFTENHFIKISFKERKPSPETENKSG